MNQGNFVLSQPIDLTNCDREPIHIPGLIQPHGLLLVLQEPDLKIIQISNNTLNFLDIPPQQLLGKSLGNLFAKREIQLIQKKVLENLTAANPIKLSLKSRKKKTYFDGFIHRSNGTLVLELEPIASSKISNFLSFYHLVQAPIDKIQKETTLPDLCQAIAQEVRKLTGFDRVMVYQFDAEGAGKVIAEDKLESLTP